MSDIGIFEFEWFRGDDVTEKYRRHIEGLEGDAYNAIEELLSFDCLERVKFIRKQLDRAIAHHEQEKFNREGLDL